MTTTIDTTRYARIAVDRGIDRYPDGLLYRIPMALDGVKGIGGVTLGDHVTVPLGRGDSRVHGVVVGIGGDELLDKKIAVDRVKSILEIDRTSDPMPSVVVRLAQWIASYYCAPIGVTIAGITPSAVRKGVGRVKKIAVDIALPTAFANGFANGFAHGCIPRHAIIESRPIASQEASRSGCGCSSSTIAATCGYR